MVSLDDDKPLLKYWGFGNQPIKHGGCTCRVSKNLKPLQGSNKNVMKFHHKFSSTTRENNHTQLAATSYFTNLDTYILKYTTCWGGGWLFGCIFFALSYIIKTDPVNNGIPQLVNAGFLNHQQYLWCFNWWFGSHWDAFLVEKLHAWNHSSSLKKKAPKRRSSPKFQTNSNSSNRCKDENIWLVVSTHLKNVSQNGNLPQIGVKINIFETTT